MFNYNVMSVRLHIRILPDMPQLKLKLHRPCTRPCLALNSKAVCCVRCEQLTLLNGHFSGSDGGADGTVGKLSVMRVWWCCTSDYSRKKSMSHSGFPPKSRCLMLQCVHLFATYMYILQLYRCRPSLLVGRDALLTCES